MAPNIRHRLDLLRALLTGEGLEALLEPLAPPELLAAHRFVREKTVEFGIRIRGKKWAQDELEAELRALGEAHAAATCPAQERQCHLDLCLEGQPQCMRKAAMAQILAMAAACKAYLQSPEPPG
ncbi:MAG TPA: hypothetical protein PKI62_08790 [bacterium]|nr:hypothetical protein [bacterium]HPR86546.1 hypothetical protein [bacterium]